jgi:dTDP-4-amino-4,6-dideoxygalactose transaminase
VTISNARADQAVGLAASVPFIDLLPSHTALKDGILNDVAELIDDGRFINGPQVEEFEGAWASYCGSQFAVGLASGLDAIRLGLLGAGIERGDEVLVPANTFVATFEAVAQAGGLPVPVDVSAIDFNIDLDAAAAAITPNTRWLLPVHLYGQMADMRALSRLAERHDLLIAEDACQAHGARRDGLRSGTVGLFGAFSFYPGKNLGAFGDAGAIVTDDAELARTMCALREHGQYAKYEHRLEGYTARLDTIQAIVLTHKLALLDDWNDARRVLAGLYRERLDGVGDLQFLPVPTTSDPVWHLFVMTTGDPERLARHLGGHGIMTNRHYPQPAHLSAAYEWLNYAAGSFPVTESLASRLLSLPIFPGMSEAQLEAVVTAVEDYFACG